MPSRPKSVPVASDPEGGTFEQSLEELESIIGALDEGAQGLDDLVAKYERGMGLLVRCQRQLDTAQLRIEQITRRAEGGADLTPMTAEAPAPARAATPLYSPSSDSPSDEIRLF
jgi:exodeoxyribonuclease VII small subunit